MVDLADLTTERTNPLTEGISNPSLSAADLLKLINDEDAKVAKVVGESLEVIARVVDEVAWRVRKGGRVIYFGESLSRFHFIISHLEL